MNELLQNQPHLFPIFFVAMWVFVCMLLSVLGGWSVLAETYTSLGNFVGKKWHMQSISIGWVNYGGCVTIGSNDKVFYLSVMLPFRIGHPPLEIPYKNIQGKEHKGIIFKYVDLNFDGTKRPKVRLFKKQADRLESISNGSWQYERL